jgi:hypothetical protein
MKVAVPGLTGQAVAVSFHGKAGPRTGEDAASASGLPPQTWHERKFGDNHRRLCGMSELIVGQQPESLKP